MSVRIRTHGSVARPGGLRVSSEKPGPAAGPGKRVRRRHLPEGGGSGGRGGAVPGLAWLKGATEVWGEAIAWVEEDDRTLADVIRNAQTERVRYAGPGRVSREVLAAANDTGVFVARAPVLAEGRVELLWYLREQSISRDYHRYGNIGERASWAPSSEDDG